MSDASDHLPARRITKIIDCRFEGMSFILALDLSRSGRIGEVHAIGLKQGSAIALLVEDACALISELLLRFVSPETLRDLMVTQPDGSAASILGAILFEVCEATQNGHDDA